MYIWLLIIILVVVIACAAFLWQRMSRLEAALKQLDDTDVMRQIVLDSLAEQRQWLHERLQDIQQNLQAQQQQQTEQHSQLQHELHDLQQSLQHKLELGHQGITQVQSKKLDSGFAQWREQQAILQQNMQERIDLGLQNITQEHNTQAEKQRREIADVLQQGMRQQQDALKHSSAEISKRFDDLRATYNNHMQHMGEQDAKARTQLEQALIKGQQAVQAGLQQSSEVLSARFVALQQSTKETLNDIGKQVEARLNDGFKHSRDTFNDILKRLTIIDQAQKNIEELSGNVVSLQSVLDDKRARGAFGEVQLKDLVANYLPANGFAMQVTLSNNTRADCVLFLPEPTGKLVIDAKFPLENYQRMQENDNDALAYKKARTQFANDVKKHINDIAKKYIIATETTDGAMMFLPAESIFAEIHAYFPDLVKFAQQKHVWMVSPTTMMAVLTTARAVLTNDAMRKHAQEIHEHLQMLGADFRRFDERMQKLSVHIRQANDDVSNIHISSSKITRRFDKIEQVNFDEDA